MSKTYVLDEHDLSLALGWVLVPINSGPKNVRVHWTAINNVLTVIVTVSEGIDEAKPTSELGGGFEEDLRERTRQRWAQGR